jgi:S-methylmethionine-dependent homocysteine/selenocysteine methylase
MINCAYPSFLNAHKQSQSALSRLIGFQANASSLDHSKLDGAGTLQADDIPDWGNLMIELNRKFGVKILGGCCGTSHKHLEYIVQKINSDQMSEADA